MVASLPKGTMHIRQPTDSSLGTTLIFVVRAMHRVRKDSMLVSRFAPAGYACPEVPDHKGSHIENAAMKYCGAPLSMPTI